MYPILTMVNIKYRNFMHCFCTHRLTYSANFYFSTTLKFAFEDFLIRVVKHSKLRMLYYKKKNSERKETKELFVSLMASSSFLGAGGCDEDQEKSLIESLCPTPGVLEMRGFA